MALSTTGSLVDTAGTLALGYAGAKAWNKHPILGAIGGVFVGGWLLGIVLGQVFSVAGPDKVVE